MARLLGGLFGTAMYSTMYRWFHDEVFMVAYREARRDLFDDIMATIDKAGNTAALALVRELHRAERDGGGFVLINAARTIIDRAMKSQSIMAVQEQMDELRRTVEAMKARRPPAPEPKLPEPRMLNPDQDPIAACRLRMLWMNQLGNSPEDIADSLRWNPPQSVAEEQGLLDAVRKQLEWERQFTGGCV